MDRYKFLSLARNSLRLGSLAIVLMMPAYVAFSSSGGTSTLTGSEAFGDWRQDKPGVRRYLTPSDLPPISPPTIGAAKVVPALADAIPAVPTGFVVEKVVTAGNPRVIRVAPNGDLFVADSKSSMVHVYRIPAGSTKPVEESVFASGLRQPFGIAFYPLGSNPKWVYVANSDSVVRFPYTNGDLTAQGQPEKVVESIPFQHHYTRDIVFSPDGSRLFLSIGSGSNVALDMSPEPSFVVFPEPHAVNGLEEWMETAPLGATWDTEERRAQVLSFDPDGKNEKTVATGLRNCSGLTIQQVTGQLWCAVNERDELGDDTPFEYATQVKEGAFYGWPWYYIGNNEDPRHPGKRMDLKGQVTMPDVLMQAHSAPIQIAFYNADSFPAEYKGSAFLTLHGSWNREKRTGYKVVRLIFDRDGKPTGEYEDFMTGFVLSDEEVWGRPTGVAVAQDGSLFVTEDGNGTIWRVSYRGKTTP